MEGPGDQEPGLLQHVPAPPSPRSAADHFCARRVQGLGDQGSQLAGGRDESPSEMRNLGPTCNPMDSFLA